MIYYESGGVHSFFSRLLWCHGSVFKPAALIALPVAVATSFLHFYFPGGTLTDGILLETQAWGGFSFSLGFLIVFRTSQAYSRFWEGCTAVHRMRAEWSESISSIFAFTKLATSGRPEVRAFKELAVRLVSMLHAAALAELECGNSEDAEEVWAYSYDIIDPGSVDLVSIQSIMNCDLRTELLCAWVQQLFTENVATGVLAVPPPILSRAFQELSNGMVAFHDAMKIANVPFPFPYAQACDCILIIHWMLVPAITSQWVTNTVWAAVFSFVQVFILWSLNLIAMEIDQPFGRDANDIDGDRMQDDMNRLLTLLLTPDIERTPHLSHELDEVERRCTAQIGEEIGRSWSATKSSQDEGADFGREPSMRNKPRASTHSAKSVDDLNAATLADLFKLATKNKAKGAPKARRQTAQGNGSSSIGGKRKLSSGRPSSESWGGSYGSHRKSRIGDCMPQGESKVNIAALSRQGSAQSVCSLASSFPNIAAGQRSYGSDQLPEEATMRRQSTPESEGQAPNQSSEGSTYSQGGDKQAQDWNSEASTTPQQYVVSALDAALAAAPDGSEAPIPMEDFSVGTFGRLHLAGPPRGCGRMSETPRLNSADTALKPAIDLEAGGLNFTALTS